MDTADLALVLAADGSASVGFDEFNRIAAGMAASLRAPDVAAALLAGPAHATLVAVLIFSGRAAQDVALPWTALRRLDDIARLADAIDAISRLPAPGLTAIGDALLAASRLLALAPARATRRVVDIAADGRANDGTDPATARDRLTAGGITINGLCVLHEEPDLVATFEREVIGGPGAFAQPCPDYAGFAEAMRRKLLREMLVA